MAAKVISVANMKGGVGKTTTSVTLAETLAANQDLRVLVIDCDPQSNASVLLAGEEDWKRLIDEDLTLDSFYRHNLINDDSYELGYCIRTEATDLLNTRSGEQANLYVACSSPDLQFTEREYIRSLITGSEDDYASILGRIYGTFESGIKNVEDSFDVIIIDCPPGISFFAEAALWIADLVIIPFNPDYISVYGLNRFVNVLSYMRENDKVGEQWNYYALASRVRGTRDHKARINEIDGLHKGHLLDTRIKENATIYKAAERMRTGKRKFYSKYGRSGGNNIKELGLEVMTRLDGLT